MANGINIGTILVDSFKVGNSDCKIYMGNIKVYPNETPPTPTIRNYLRFVSKGTGTFTFFANGSDSANTLSYSLNSGETWTQLGNGVESPTVANGDVIMWKGDSPTIVSNKGIGTFSSTTAFDVEGNIMSLHFGDNFETAVDLTGKDTAFMNLFSGCTTVINADKLELPATTLSRNCYTNLFNRASNLVSPPSLTAATTLAVGCYFNMFYCYPSSSSLIVSESYFLPATTLVQDCYRQMFYGRSGFNKITCLATSGINTNNSTNNWLTNTASSGTFTRAPGVYWPTGNNGRKNWTLVDYRG